MKSTEFEIRNRIIYLCYDTGEFTYRALGKIFNLSRTRIMEIYRKGVRRQRMRQRREQWPSSFLDLPVEYLDISVRVYHALNGLELKCVGDVLNTDETTFLRYPNFGRLSLNRLKLAVQEVAEKYKGTENDRNGN